MPDATKKPRSPLATRFRGFLPVVVDVETGGFDWNRHALLEIAVAPIDIDESGQLFVSEITSSHVVPATGTQIDPKSLEITGIILDHPFRDAKPERVALDLVFAPVREAMRKHGCQRAILVGHNAHFDLNFLNAAVARVQHKRNPFHPFSVFDTVTLAGVAYGQTVLARAVQAAGFDWNSDEAHSAIVGRIPMGRSGSAADVEGIMVYLASDESSFATGAAFAVDGGMSSL